MKVHQNSKRQIQVTFRFMNFFSLIYPNTPFQDPIINITPAKNFDDMTREELIQELQKRGLPTTGLRVVLLKRLKVCLISSSFRPIQGTNNYKGRIR